MREVYHTGVEESLIVNQQQQEASESRSLLVVCWFSRFLVLAAFAVLCCGCGIVGVATMKHFSLSDEIALDGSTDNVMPVVEEVGKSLGYRVSGRMKLGGSTSLIFQRDASFLLTATTGYTRSATFTVAHNTLEKKLQITMALVGSYGGGTEADVQKELQVFKEKVQVRLGAQK